MNLDVCLKRCFSQEKNKDFDAGIAKNKNTKLVTVGEAEGLFEASMAGRLWQKMLFFLRKIGISRHWA